MKRLGEATFDSVVAKVAVAKVAVAKVVAIHEEGGTAGAEIIVRVNRHQPTKTTHSCFAIVALDAHQALRCADLFIHFTFIWYSFGISHCLSYALVELINKLALI